MNIIKKLKYLKKGTEENTRIVNIISELPDNKSCALEILKDINNSKTKVILDGGLKNSYYVFLNDTIYLSNRKKVKTNFARICLVAHECVHSIQSKVLQVINFILSNLEILSFVLLLIIGIIHKLKYEYIMGYIVIIALNLFVRYLLELHAVFNSTKLASNYLKKYLDDNKQKEVNSIYFFWTRALLPIFVISLCLGKFIRVIILTIIYYFI